jgi:PilZ domain
MIREQRGLRLPFSTDAEVIPENSREGIPARVKELSLRGCFLEMSSSLKEHQRLRVKMSHSGHSFEASAEVLYVRPTGVGILFDDLKPHSRSVLQAWVLAALDTQVELEHP